MRWLIQLWSIRRSFTFTRRTTGFCWKRQTRAKQRSIMPEAVIVSAVRTPVGRAPKGALSTTRPDDLAAIALRGVLDKIPVLDRAEIDDVILGCAQPEGEQGWNIARWALLRAG